MLKTKTGIVLKRFPFKEADMGLRILLEDGELLFLTLHGIRNSKRRSNLITEPGTEISAVYYEHSGGQGSLKEGNILNDFLGIKKNYDSLLVVAVLLELSENAAQGHHHAELYRLLKGGLTELENEFQGKIQPGWLYAFLGFFKIRLARILGILGDTEHCAECGQTLGETAASSHFELSFLCSECGSDCSREIAEMARLIARAAHSRFSSYFQELTSAHLAENIVTELDRLANNSIENFYSQKLTSSGELYRHLATLSGGR